MKTLVVVGHPHLNESRIHKCWVDCLRAQLDKETYTVHVLEESRQGGAFQISVEQQLIEAHDRLVLEFPLYWYSVPAIMKQWLDDVILEGWAYGEGGNKMEGKLIDVALSCGGPESVFNAPDGIKMASYMHFISSVAKFVRADFGSIFCLYDAEGCTDELLEKSTREYLDFIKCTER